MAKQSESKASRSTSKSGSTRCCSSKMESATDASRNTNTRKSSKNSK